MKIRSYNREIEIVTRMLIDIFNEIEIDRHKPDGTVQQIISVPCVYGNRDRALKSLENKNATIKPPIITISQTGIYKDEERTHSSNDFIKYQADNGFDVRNNMPVPINIDFTLSIITKYQEDMDQIVSNFMPFFSPTVYFVWKMPNGNGNLKTQVMWDGALSYIYPTDIADTDAYRIIVETNFTVKTYIHPGIWDGKSVPKESLIYRINFTHNPDNISSDSISGQLDGWYDVKYTTIDDYIEKVKSGLILAPNFDKLPISGGINHSYFQNISAEISGTIYDPHIPADLYTMITNFENPDLHFVFNEVISTPMQKSDIKAIWTQLYNDLNNGLTTI